MKCVVDILVKKRNDTKISMKYIFMLKQNQNGKLFTFDDSPINDHRLFKCLVRSSQTRSWDGKFTLHVP
jgi:hypothetical protein